MLEDVNGVSPAPSWRPSRILSDNRIAAFEADTSSYAFRIPGKITRVSLSARLLYRRFFKEWMDTKGFNIPDILMESDTLTIDTDPFSFFGRIDYDGNGQIDFQDFVQFALHYGQKKEDVGFDARFDLDRNGNVDFPDFLQFLRYFSDHEASE